MLNFILSLFSFLFSFSHILVSLTSLVADNLCDLCDPIRQVTLCSSEMDGLPIKNYITTFELFNL